MIEGSRLPAHLSAHGPLLNVLGRASVPYVLLRLSGWWSMVAPHVACMANLAVEPGISTPILAYSSDIFISTFGYLPFLRFLMLARFEVRGQDQSSHSRKQTLNH